MSKKEQIKQQAIDALETVNQSSSIARALYISFIGLTAYITVNLLSTNDIDLLYYTPLKLPLLGVTIDLKGFYALVPWLYLIIHINLLLVFSVLARKLHHFESRIIHLNYPERQSLRKQLHVFGLTQTISARNSGLLGWLLNFTLWITASLVPIALLMLIQIDFLPAQEQGIVWSQRVALLIDCGITFFFWHRIMQERRYELMPKNWKPFILNWTTTGGWVLILFSGGAVMLSFVFATVPLGSWERFLVGVYNPECKVSTIHWKDVFVGGSKVDEEKQKEFSKAILIASEKEERSRNRKCELGWTHSLFDKEDSIFSRQLRDTHHQMFTQNQVSAEIVNRLKASKENNEDIYNNLNIQQDYLDKILGINLEKRSFRYANFDSSYFPKAQLKKSQFQFSRLSEAVLIKTKLNFAQFQGALLRRTSLQGAFLRRASFQGANLRKASLYGAFLHRAIFQGADLIGTQLQGAQLWNASFQGALLGAASLEGADLRFAKLQGAQLKEASLQGANLFSAKLQGADLRSTKLQSAQISSDFNNTTVSPGTKIDSALIYTFKHSTLPPCEAREIIEILTRLEKKYKDGIVRIVNACELGNMFIGKFATPKNQTYCYLKPKFSYAKAFNCKTSDKDDSTSPSRKSLREEYIETWSQTMTNIICKNKNYRYILNGMKKNNVKKMFPSLVKILKSSVDDFTFDCLQRSGIKRWLQQNSN